MKKVRFTIALIYLIGVQSCWAGLFDRKPAAAPTPQQVMTTLHNLKNNPDSGKRTTAAEELQQLDVQKFPEILPALIDSLQNDTNTGVRRSAATTLGRVRPFSSEAAQALEVAKEKDSSIMVRMQARTALLGYRVPNQPLVQLPAKQAKTGVPHTGAPQIGTAAQAQVNQFQQIQNVPGNGQVFIEVPNGGNHVTPISVSSGGHPIITQQGSIIVPGPDASGKIHPVAVPQFSQQPQVIIPAGMVMPGVADGPVQLAPMPRVAP